MAVSPQLETFSRDLVREKKFTFELLSDPGNRVAKSFGLSYTLPEELKAVYLQFGIDLGKFNGDDLWMLPIPARYIIDTSGVVRYRESDPDYTVRPEPAHTIEALRNL